MAEGTVRFNCRQTPYTQVSNAALRDKRMSLAARGLFALMLSLPPGKDYKISYLAKAGGVGRETIYKYIGILEQLGYLKREQTHEKGGKFGANSYSFNDNPSAPRMVFPCTEKPDTVQPCTGNADTNDNSSAPRTDLPYTEKPDTVEPDTVQPCTENADTKEILTERNHTPPKSPQGGNARASATPKWRADRFEAFWEYYRTTFCAADHRRAGNRTPAAKAWDKLKPDDETIGAIGKALVATMQTELWGRGIGIAYASTYLNGRYWEGVDLAPPAEQEAPREQEAWGWQ